MTEKTKNMSFVLLMRIVFSPSCETFITIKSSATQLLVSTDLWEWQRWSWPAFTSVTYTLCSPAYLCFFLYCQWLKSVGACSYLKYGPGSKMFFPKTRIARRPKCVAALLLYEVQIVVQFHRTAAGQQFTLLLFAPKSCDFEWSAITEQCTWLHSEGWMSHFKMFFFFSKKLPLFHHDAVSLNNCNYLDSVEICRCIRQLSLM